MEKTVSDFCLESFCGELEHVAGPSAVKSRGSFQLGSAGAQPGIHKDGHNI